MNKEKYTPLEIGILLFFLLNSFTSSILIKNFKNTSSVNIILSILISTVIGFIILKILFKLWNDDFLNNISNTKILSIIFKIIFIISAIAIGVYSIFNISIIIKETILPNMSQKTIELTFLILATILAIKGMKSISIATSLMFLVYLLVIIIDYAFNLFNVDPINLLPITLNINKINFYQTLILTIGPIFMLLIIPKKEIINFRKCKKDMNIFYLIFYVYLTIKILFIISILGEKYFAIVSHPEIEILKMINIFNFFERLEELLIISMFIENLVTTSFAIYYLYNTINSIYDLKKKTYILINIIIFLILIKIDILPNSYLITILTIFIITNIFTYKKNIKNNNEIVPK